MVECVVRELPQRGNDALLVEGFDDEIRVDAVLLLHDERHVDVGFRLSEVWANVLHKGPNGRSRRRQPEDDPLPGRRLERPVDEKHAEDDPRECERQAEQARPGAQPVSLRHMGTARMTVSRSMRRPPLEQLSMNKPG